MLLNVVEIEKYYGTRNNLKKALDRVCFSVNAGDFVRSVWLWKNNFVKLHFNNRPGKRRSYISG